MISRLILLILLTLHLDIWTIFETLIVFVLAIWWVSCALRGSSLVGLVPLILRPRFWTCICQFLRMIFFLPKFMIRDNLGFEIVNFPFLDGDVPPSAFSGVCVSRLVCFAGPSGRVAAFGTRSGLLAWRLLGQGYQCHKFRKTFF